MAGVLYDRLRDVRIVISFSCYWFNDEVSAGKKDIKIIFGLQKDELPPFDFQEMTDHDVQGGFIVFGCLEIDIVYHVKVEQIFI